MTPTPTWPRKLLYIPIIMMAVVQQYLIGMSLLLDPAAHFATPVHILYIVFPTVFLPIILLSITTLSVIGFMSKRKINTLLCLVPQQFLLYLSAGSAFQAVWQGHFADGVIRSHAFILADQAPVILLAIFHTWAMALLLRYGYD